MATARIDVKNLPAFAELYRATHVVLVARLEGWLNTSHGLTAWNDLLTAHDEIAMANDD